MRLFPSRTKPKKPVPPVTAIIGFTAAPFIVLASDSLVSFQGEDFKRPNQRKIIPLRFYETQAVLAMAGDVEVASLLEEELERYLEYPHEDTPRAVAGLVEKSVKKIRNKMQANFYSDAYPSGATADYMNERKSVFVLGYYHKGKPQLYAIELLTAYAAPVKHQFIAVGTGRSVASMLLDGLDLTAMRADLSFGLAAYVIEMCKSYSGGCGGATQMAVLADGVARPPFFFHPDDMRLFEEAAQKVRGRVGIDLANAIAEKYDELAKIWERLRGSTE